MISFLSFVENFFGGVPPLTKFSGAIRYTESVKAAWKRLCEEAVWGFYHYYTDGQQLLAFVGDHPCGQYGVAEPG